MDDYDYIQLRISIFDDESSEVAKVRRSITIDTLIKEILFEFKEDLDQETPETYALYRKGERSSPLARDQRIKNLDLHNQDELVFRRLRFTARIPIRGNQQPALRYERDRSKVIRLEWQPAIIGRPDAASLHNHLLAVDVEGLPGGVYASRRHAQIVQEEGGFYIERLARMNPTTVNGKDVSLVQKQLLHTGDRIELGRSRIGFTFILEDRDEDEPHDSSSPGTQANNGGIDQ